MSRSPEFIGIEAHKEEVLKTEEMAFEVLFSSILASLLFLFLVIDAHEHAVRLQSFTSPHGIVYENPMSFPPSAYDFFHSNYSDTAAAPATAPPPIPASSSSSFKARAVAAAVAAAGGVFSDPPGRRSVGAHAAAAGGAAVVVGLLLVVLAALVAAYVVIKHRADLKRAVSTVNAGA